MIGMQYALLAFPSGGRLWLENAHFAQLFISLVYNVSALQVLLFWKHRDIAYRNL